MPDTFLLFDAARATEENLDRASALNEEKISLYRGRAEEELTAIAPYIFSFPNSKDFSDFILQNGWGNSWGIFAVSDKSIEDIFQHFTKFLMVTTSKNEEVYFRFYDPRVLRIFLPTCDTGQLKELFGPIEKFICEDSDPLFSIHFSFDGKKLFSERIPVDKAFNQKNTAADNEGNDTVLKEGKPPRSFFY